MVVMALADLALIGFDLSYIRARPFYLEVAPRLVTLYDPVKGMRPHPTSERLLREMRETRTSLKSLDGRTVDLTALERHVRQLRHLSLRILREDAFVYAEEAGFKDVLYEVIGHEVGIDPANMGYPPLQEKSVETLWPMDQRRLLERLQREDGPVVKALKSNYFRRVEVNGDAADYFVWLELPLLSLFWLDFWFGWVRALHTEPSARWYDYPLRNWYDLIGLLPGTLRLLRLLRLVSLYTRIYRGELREVRENMLQQLASRVAQILVVDVTNRVQVLALRRLQAELQEETIQNALATSLSRQKQVIMDLVIDQLRHVLSHPETQARARELLSLATEEVLRSPHVWHFARDLTRNLADRAALTALETLEHLVQSEQGCEALRELVLAASKEAQRQPSFQRLQDVVSTVALDTLKALGIATEQRGWTFEPGPGEAPPPAPNPTAKSEPKTALTVTALRPASRESG